MKVTNSERREVAARLRDMRKRMDGETPPQGVTQAASEYLLRIACCVKLGSSGNLFNRLADLMDRPTCRNLAKPRGMAPVETGDWFECSECHCKARQNAIGMVVRYCPHCGAEVVE